MNIFYVKKYVKKYVFVYKRNCLRKKLTLNLDPAVLRSDRGDGRPSGSPTDLQGRPTDVVDDRKTFAIREG